MPTYLRRAALMPHIEALGDAELIELHRDVSRLARAAYGRTERYQRNYAAGTLHGKAKVAAARARTSPGNSSGAAIRDVTTGGQ